MVQKEANMNGTDLFKCSHCRASYNSEKELLEHEKAAHHASYHGHDSEATSTQESGKGEGVNQHDKAKAKKA
jgi:hypothetical protein